MSPRTVIFVAILAFIGGMHAGGYLEREHGARRSAERQSGLNGSGSTVRRWLGVVSVRPPDQAGVVTRPAWGIRPGGAGCEGPASDKVETEITVCHSVPPPIVRLRPASLAVPRSTYAERGLTFPVVTAHFAPTEAARVVPRATERVLPTRILGGLG